MPFFRAIHRNASYAVIADRINQVIIPMTFDTGAVNTVISLSAYSNKAVNQIEFVRQIETRCRRKEFHSASGESLNGYYVCAENVSISGFPLEKFYYFLLPESQQGIALLGDDFISYCAFHHDAQKDIIVSGFDEDAYYNSPQEAIRQDELNRILQLVVEK